MSGTWATTPTSCRDLPDAGWATAPTAGRDRTFGAVYGGGGLAEFDALAGSGTVTTATGWTTPVPGSCRDG